MMNACTAKTLLSAAAVAAMLIVGCSSAAPSEEDVTANVDSSDVDPNATIGGKISSSSGVIGSTSGVIVINPSPPPPPTPPVNCGDVCWPDPSNTGCVCPGGYGYGSTITCPYSAPVIRFIGGLWRCYGH